MPARRDDLIAAFRKHAQATYRLIGARLQGKPSAIEEAETIHEAACIELADLITGDEQRA